MMAYASSVLRILFLGNEMRESREDTASILCQEKTRLNLMLREDMPQSYVKRGHASILCQERTHLDPGQERIYLDLISGRTVDTPQSYVRRGQ